jgi:hypothetical protein
MTYWDRIINAIRNGARGSAYDINQIEIHYDEGDKRPPAIIQGGDQSHDFLAAYASFDEVQAALKLPGTINHISCVNILDDVNITHSGIEYTTAAYDEGTIEEFYRDGPSMLEQEVAAKARDK